MFFALLPSKESDDLFGEPAFEILSSLMHCLVYSIEIYTIASITNAVIEEADKLSTYIHKSLFIEADKRFIRCVSAIFLVGMFDENARNLF